MLRAISGSPSFFTSGNIANLSGASLAGSFSTTRLSCCFINIIVKVLQLFFAVLLVVAQVKIGTAVNAFHFFKTNREIIFNIAGGIGIMSQLRMVMKAVFIGR